MLCGLSVGRYITRVSQCRDRDASFVSSEMSVAPNTSHKRQSLGGYCGGPRNEKTCMGVASAQPAKNQRPAFEDCLMSAVGFAFNRHGDIPSRCRGAFESRCCTVPMDRMGNEVSSTGEIQIGSSPWHSQPSAEPSESHVTGVEEYGRISQLLSAISPYL